MAARSEIPIRTGDVKQRKTMFKRANKGRGRDKASSPPGETRANGADRSIKSIMIAIPCTFTHVYWPFTRSVIEMLLAPRMNELADIGVNKYFVAMDDTFPLDVGRNRLCQGAIDKGVDAIIFLDVDQTYPGDTLIRLVETANKPGIDVVGALYFKKVYPHSPVAGIFSKENPNHQIYYPIELYEYKKIDGKLNKRKKEKPIECDVLGMGGTLIRTEVLKKIKSPWFAYGRSIETGEMTITEDIHFCRQAKAHGFKLYCDPQIVSGHMTNFEFDDVVWNKVSANYIPESDEYLSYGQEYYEHPTQTLYADKDEHYESLAGMLTDIMEPYKTVLDVGCGLGRQVEILKEMGFKVHGIDSSEYAIQQCTEKGLPVTRALAWHTHLALNGQKPDVILTSELLEHLTEKEIEDTIESFTQSGASKVFGTINFRDRMPTHKTIMRRDWWDAKFAEHGWAPCHFLQNLQKQEKYNRSIIYYVREVN